MTLHDEHLHTAVPQLETEAPVSPLATENTSASTVYQPSTEYGPTVQNSASAEHNLDQDLLIAEANTDQPWYKRTITKVAGGVAVFAAGISIFAGVHSGGEGDSSAKPASTVSASEHAAPKAIDPLKNQEVISQYHITSTDISYANYGADAQAYAQTKGLPITTFDLSHITTPLTATDAEKIAPFLIQNFEIAWNTKASTAPLFNVNGASEDMPNDVTLPGFSTILSSADGTLTTKPKLSVVTYPGAVPEYQGKQITLLSFDHVPMKRIWARDLPAGTPPLSQTPGRPMGTSELSFQLMYDPTSGKFVDLHFDGTKI
jgi:hypothetical protein